MRLRALVSSLTSRLPRFLRLRALLSSGLSQKELLTARSRRDAQNRRRRLSSGCPRVRGICRLSPLLLIEDKYDRDREREKKKRGSGSEMSHPSLSLGPRRDKWCSSDERCVSKTVDGSSSPFFLFARVPRCWLLGSPRAMHVRTLSDTYKVFLEPSLYNWFFLDWIIDRYRIRNNLRVINAIEDESAFFVN